ncbi:MAG TPA: GldG family protein [Polyangiaceae bacterium]|nr:GldG family protein [Polyangiaceae bacterium]
MERRTKAAAETSVYLVIIAAILVVVNVIAFVAVHTRFDTTRNERFTLSKGSAGLVKTLKSPVHVDAYVTRGLPKLDAFVRDLTDLLRLYQQKGGSNFEYSIIEAKTEEQRSAAKEAGLRDVSFGQAEEGEDKESFSQGYMGLVFKYGSEKDNIPIIQPDRADGLEFWISNKIREIRDKADGINHKIGVITNKDEIKLTDTNLVPAQGQGKGPSIKGVIDQAFPFYKIEDVDLKDGSAEINKELDGLIITQPGKDFTDKELRRIDQFMMLGNKSLVVYASAVNLKAGDASMKATLSTHNLDKLLAGYGVEMKKNAVLDWRRGMRLPVLTQMGGAAWIRSPGVVQAQRDPSLKAEDPQQILDDGFAAFFRSDELSFPFPSSLVPHPDKQPEAKLRVVARSTPQSWAETGESVDLKISPTWKAKPPLSQHAIAIAVEGTLKAAMGSGDDVDVPAASKDKSRVLVVSAAGFLTNPFARSGAGTELGGQFQMMGPVGGDQQLQMIAGPYAQKYLTGTILSFKNTLDWMSGDSDLIAASAKILGEPNLTYDGITRPSLTETDDDNSIKKKDEEYRDARKNTQRNVQLALTLLCPLLFAGFGILRWRQREGGRANIILD